MAWLDSFHLGMTLSDHERAIKEPSQRGALLNLKLRLLSVFTAFYNVAKGHPVVISRSKPAKNSFHTLIFVSDLRLDLTGNTVIDACALPTAILDNDTVCDASTKSSKTYVISAHRKMYLETWERVRIPCEWNPCVC